MHAPLVPAWKACIAGGGGAKHFYVYISNFIVPYPISNIYPGIFKRGLSATFFIII